MKTQSYFRKLFRGAALLKATTLLALLIFISNSAYSQTPDPNDWPNLKRYAEENKAYLESKPGKKRVVFIGDSMTEQWIVKNPEFFSKNKYLCRGFSGQASSQILLRFKQDVVNIGATTVVILAGTNDIAGNRGPSTLEMIMDNISSMCEIAKAHNIEVILCSLTPVKKYSWAPNITPDIIVPEFNKMLKEYAKENEITYVDYFKKLVDKTPGNENGMIPEYTIDGVHCSEAGYAVMEKAIKKHL